MRSCPRVPRSPRTNKERWRRMANAVSSRGCSRIFILKVLIQAYDYVASLDTSPDFPFNNNLVKSWLDAAKVECGSSSFADVLGGISFDDDDVTSHWTQPRQFFTWWKNNVERRSKFATLIKDAEYVGDNEKAIQRAEFCANVVALANNIRMHFDRYRVMENGVDVPGEQIAVPCLLTRLSHASLVSSSSIPQNNSVSTFAVPEEYAGYESELDEHMLMKNTSPQQENNELMQLLPSRDGIASRCSSSSISMITAGSGEEPYRSANPPSCDLYDMLDLFRDIDMTSPPAGDNNSKEPNDANTSIIPSPNLNSTLFTPITDASAERSDESCGDVIGICPPKSTLKLTLHKPLVRRQNALPMTIETQPPLTSRSTSSVETSSTCTPPNSSRSSTKRRYSFDISVATGADEGGKTSRSNSVDDDTYYFCTSPTDEEYPQHKRSTPQHRAQSASSEEMVIKEEPPFTFFHPDFELHCAIKEEI